MKTAVLFPTVHRTLTIRKLQMLSDTVPNSLQLNNTNHNYTIGESHTTAEIRGQKTAANILRSRAKRGTMLASESKSVGYRLSFENLVSNKLLWGKLPPSKHYEGDVSNVSPSSKRMAI